MIDLLKKQNKNWGVLCEPLSPFLLNIEQELIKEYNSYNVFPKKEDIFNAFKLDPTKIKVLIIGADPYNGTNEADGLAFSCQDKIPPSLQIMFNELERTYNKQRFVSDLSDWRDQGVFLLNTILTVRRGAPLSHEHLNWTYFTHTIIRYLYNKGVIVLCFGTKAKDSLLASIKGELNENVLVCGHPAADARGKKKKFYGTGIFKQCNDLLIKKNQPPINWIGDDYEESIYSRILGLSNTTVQTTDK